MKSRHCISHEHHDIKHMKTRNPRREVTTRAVITISIMFYYHGNEVVWASLLPCSSCFLVDYILFNYMCAYYCTDLVLLMYLYTQK